MGDRVNETIEIDGRRFPTIALVCPPVDERDDETELERSLGALNDPGRYVPAENGLIFEVRPQDGGVWGVHLLCAVCHRCKWLDNELWLPMSVVWYADELTAFALGNQHTPKGTYEWNGCESWWVVEMIDRLSRLPLVLPDGPRCELADRQRIEEADADRS